MIQLLKSVIVKATTRLNQMILRYFAVFPMYTAPKHDDIFLQLFRYVVLDALRFCPRVIRAVALQKINYAPNSQSRSQRDDECA